MATVKLSGHNVAFLSGNCIKLFDLCQDTNCTLYLPENPSNGTKQNSKKEADNGKKQQAKNPASTVNHNEKDNNGVPEKKSEESEKKCPENLVSGSNRTLSAAFSNSGHFFAVSDDRKQLHLYQKSNSTDEDDIVKEKKPRWYLLTSRSVVRRATCLLFTKDENDIIVGDKSGDVYKFSVLNPNEPCQLLMGHLSMLLDMVLADNDRYLVTCDRDEKIRVSHFPNSYNIHSYCLGHTDFLTRLVYLPRSETIISAGGDGTIRCWDLQGQNLHCLKHGVNNQNVLSEKEPESNEIESGCGVTVAAVKCMALGPANNILALSFDQSKLLQLYKIEANNEPKYFKIKLCDQRELTSEPWDLQFLTDTLLLVLLPIQHNSILIFDCCTSSEESSSPGPKIRECSSGQPQHPKGMKTFLENVNIDWAFFERSLKVGSLISLLPKSKIDNMADYEERKEQQVKKKFQRKGKRKQKQNFKEAGKKSKIEH